MTPSRPYLTPSRCSAWFELCAFIIPIVMLGQANLNKSDLFRDLLLRDMELLLHCQHYARSQGCRTASCRLSANALSRGQLPFHYRGPQLALSRAVERKSLGHRAKLHFFNVRSLTWYENSNSFLHTAEVIVKKLSVSSQIVLVWNNCLFYLNSILIPQ